jgi:hypothetical protein
MYKLSPAAADSVYALATALLCNAQHTPQTLSLLDTHKYRTAACSTTTEPLCRVTGSGMKMRVTRQLKILRVLIQAVVTKRRATAARRAKRSRNRWKMFVDEV